jgi:DNA mismatch repair protein MutS2
LLGVAGWRRLLLRRIHYHEGVPEIVKDTSARVLEFDLLRELLRGYAASDLGRSKVAAMAASRDLEWIRRQHQLTSEVREFRRCSGGFEFAGLVNISPLLQKAQISGAALETTEIRDTVGTVDRAAGWREIALNPPQGMKQDWRAVRELSAGIGDFTEFLRGFRNAILPDGTLEDRASPSLAGIRREIEKQKRAIQDSLRSHLRRLSEGETLQEEVVTIRGERFVIPVKTEHKRRVQGVVHGASSSGQTVFIEPLETIEQNNELVRLLEEEQAEIRRILLEMTGRIAERAIEIAQSLEILGELELQFAKARFAEEYECVAPLIGEDVPRRPSGPPSAGSTSAAPPPQPRDSSFVMRVIRCSSGICGQRVALLSPQPSNSNANSGS